MNTYRRSEKKPKIRIDARYGFRYYVIERGCTFSYSETMIFVKILAIKTSLKHEIPCINFFWYDIKRINK